MARLDGSKRAHHRSRRSEKRRKRNSSKLTKAGRSLASRKDFVAPQAPKSLAPTTPRLELEDEFFSRPPAAVALPLVEEEPSHAVVLTTGQLARRRWFRQQVTHLMAGLTAFTGFAALVHIAQFG